MTTTIDCNAFINGYLKAALWTTDDFDGTPFEHLFNTDQFSDHGKSLASRDCLSFISANEDAIKAYLEAGFSSEEAGIDFWLTRNGHGTGFWDRVYSTNAEFEPFRKLSLASKAYGGSYVYIGDDKGLYLM